MRIHLTAASCVLVAAGVLELSIGEWSLLILCIGLVLMAELLNTAIESLVDLVSPERHELARQAKDMAAGAVLTAALTASVVGGMVLLPRLWEILGRTLAN